MSIENKKELIKADLKSKHGCQGPCEKCTKVFKLIDLMADAKIPVGYWFLNMVDFKGPVKLKEIVDEYTKEIKSHYLSGRSVCFAGNQGTGKTLSAISILKAAIKSGFTAYYVTASDMLGEITDYDTSSQTKNTLKNVDFLVIDELDSRFFISDSTKELFSSIYEGIFRGRSANQMPTIICTNEVNGLDKVFYGAGVQSIKSLNAQYLTIYPFAGVDFRKGM